jgi:hypothetical protein
MEYLVGGKYGVEVRVEEGAEWWLVRHAPDGPRAHRVDLGDWGALEYVPIAAPESIEWGVLEVALHVQGKRYVLGLLRYERR